MANMLHIPMADVLCPLKGIDVNSFTDFMLVMSKECNQSVDELSKSFTEALKTISTIEADAKHTGNKSVRSKITGYPCNDPKNNRDQVVPPLISVVRLTTQPIKLLKAG